MIATLLLGLIGLTDLARVGRSTRTRWGIVTTLWVGFAVASVLGLGLTLLEAGVVVLVVLGWVLLMPSDDAAAPRRLWPVPLLVVVVLVAVLVGGDGSRGVAAAELYLDLVGDRAGVIPFPVVVAALALTAFLTTSGNIIVRAALGRAHSRPGSESGRIVWELRVGGHALGEIGEKSTPAAESTLKGGRLIGPIERLLIVPLALSGSSVLIAALVAAKGVVRFPEISEDRGIGSKAEEFLVGSLTSWSLSAAAAGYLAAVIHL